MFREALNNRDFAAPASLEPLRHQVSIGLGSVFQRFLSQSLLSRGLLCQYLLSQSLLSRGLPNLGLLGMEDNQAWLKLAMLVPGFSH